MVALRAGYAAPAARIDVHVPTTPRAVSAVPSLPRAPEVDSSGRTSA